MLLNVYTSRYTANLAREIEFEWDDENRKHLAAHKVTPAEFEYVLTNNAVDLGYESVDDEERYRSAGRQGAAVSDKKAFLEMYQ